MKTRAAVLYELNKPLVIEEIDIPELMSGQVLVKLFYSGVCHSQLMEARGRRGEDKYLPHLLGHEATGEVVEAGPGISKVKKGDKVVLTWIKCQGLEAGGAVYKKRGIKINSGSVTTFSEYSVVSENRCVKLPEGIPLDLGSLLGCAVLTGAGIITNTIKPEKGKILAFFGIGGIGLSALMAATLYQVSRIIAVDVEEYKLNLAKEFGAKHVINAAKEDPVKKIMELTDGKGVDYAIEASGKAKIIEQAFQSVRKNGGLCLFASHPAHHERIVIDPFDLICGKQIKGSWGGDSDPDRDIPRFAKLYLEGKLPLTKILGRRYSLPQINEALADIENRRVTRALLEINK